MKIKSTPSVSPEASRDPQQLLADSRVLIDRATVEAAVDRWSVRVSMWLAGLPGDTVAVALVILRGGILPAAWLLQRLRYPMELDFVQVSRYHNQLRGAQLEWRHAPQLDLGERSVLLIDDIFDEGHTMADLKTWCLERGAAAVLTTVLVRKQHDRGLPRDWIDLHALEVPDRYVFGCGMDVHGHWRHLPEIRLYLQDGREDE